jgi:multiple sugar transport system permease protein
MDIYRRRNKQTYWKFQRIEGYLLISPWLIGLVLFVLGPIIISFWMSFTNWDIVRSPDFIGLDNYRRLFFEDRLFKQSVYNTLFIAAGSVPLSLSVALALAILLNQGIPGTNIARTVFYLPSMVSLVAMGLLFRWMLSPRIGVVNYLLGLIGIQGPSWMGDPLWTKPALILVSVLYIGPQMIIFLTGLKGIPAHLYESAELDGAGVLAKFRNITLPMLSPAIFFNMVTSVIHAFQIFALVFVMFSGPSTPAHGPLNSTLTYSLYIYEKAFQHLNMGYASALAWIMFIIIMALTLFQLRFSSWVYYERGGK